MTVAEYLRKNAHNVVVTWAADAHGGFGSKGSRVSGKCSDLEVVEVIPLTKHWAEAELRVWNYSWGDCK